MTEEKRPESPAERRQPGSSASGAEAPTRVHSLEDLEALLQEEMRAHALSEDDAGVAPVAAPVEAARPLDVELDLDDLLEGLDADTRNVEVDPLTGVVMDPPEEVRDGTMEKSEEAGADDDLDDAFFSGASLRASVASSFAELEAELAASGVSPAETTEPPAEPFDPFTESRPSSDSTPAATKDDAARRGATGVHGHADETQRTEPHQELDDVLLDVDHEPSSEGQTAPTSEQADGILSRDVPPHAVQDTPDHGAVAALRTLRRRRREAERFELIGEDADSAMARRELLRELAERSEGASRADALVAAGELAEAHGHVEDALADYLDAIEADSTHLPALRGARRLQWTLQEWTSVADSLAREAEHLEDPEERMALTALRAEVHARALGETKRAEAWLQEALEGAPGADSGATSASLALWMLRAHLSLRQGRAAPAAEALERAVTSWGDTAAKEALAQHAAAIWELVEEDRRALRILDALPTEAYLSPWARALRLRLHERLSSSESPGAFDALLHDISECLGERAAPLHVAWAQRALARGESPTRVLGHEAPPWLLRALALAAWSKPGEGLEETSAEAAERWAAAASGSDRAAARCLQALAWGRAGRLEAAEAALQEAERGGEAPELVHWVRESLHLAPPREEAPSYEAAARHLLRGESDAEVEALQRDAEGVRPEAADVLLLDALHFDTRDERVAAALERMVRRRAGADRLAAWVAWSAASSARFPWERARTVTRALLAEASESPWAVRLAHVILERAEGAPVSERVGLQAEVWFEEAASAHGRAAADAALRAARLAREAGDEERALEALREAMEVAPDFPPVHWRLQEHARRLGLTDVLLESLQLAAEAAESNEEAARLHAQAAWLRLEADPRGGLDELELLLERVPGDTVAKELALEIRRHLAEEREELPARLLSLVEEGRSTLALEHAVEAALRATALDRDEEAADAWRAALRIEERPEFQDALHLAWLSTGRHAEVAERRLSAVREADDERRAEALEALVAFDLYERDDTASAVLTAQQLLEAHPEHLLALRLLERQFMADGRMEELARLEALFAEVFDGGGMDAAHRRMAVRAMGAAQISDGDEWVDEALLRWARQERLDAWLALRAEGAALDAGDADALVAARAVRLATTEEPFARASAASRLAEALERAGRAEEALEPLAEAIQGAPRHGPAQEHLARLAARMGRNELAAESFERAAAASSVSQRAAALAYRAARLWQERLDRPERALQAFRVAAEREITYLDTFERLHGLLKERGAHEELLDLVRRRIEAGAPGTLLASLYMLRAEAARSLGRHEEEHEALRSALALEPERREALDRLADLAFSSERWREAAEVLVRAARLTRDRERLRDIFMRLGHIYAEHLPDHRRAETAYRRALKLSPDDLDAMRNLAHVLRTQGRHAEAVETLRRIASAEADPDTQREVRLNLAEVLEEQGAIREAEAELERARRAHPTDMALLQALTRFYERHDAGAALSVHLGRALSDFRHAVEADPSDLAAWHGLCEVLHWRRQPEASRACARIALTLGLRHERLSELAGHDPLPGIGTSVRADEVDEALAPAPLSLGTREAFRLAREALDKVFPLAPQYAGSSPVPRDVPMAQDAAAVARWLGLETLRVERSDTHRWAVIPVSASPTTVLLGAEWFQRAEPERRFVLARAAKLAAEGLGVLVRLAPEQALRAMAALVLHYHPEAVPEPLRTEEQADLGKRIAKAMKRRARNELDALMVELAGAVFAPRAALPRAVACFGNRVALLAGGEPDAALEALCHLHHRDAFPSPQTPGSRIALVREHVECWDLLRFAIGDVHITLRERFATTRR